MDLSETKAVLTVLQHIHSYAWTLQSDDSRCFANEIAAAASMGYISTEVVYGSRVFGRRWKITVRGLAFLCGASDLIAEEELAHFRRQSPAASASGEVLAVSEGA